MLESLSSIPPLFFALFAAAGIAAWSILSRRVLKNEKDFVAVGGLNEILASAFMLILILLLGTDLGPARSIDFSRIPVTGWLALAASSILYTIFTFLNYKAFQTVEATERAVVSQIQIGWVVLMGVLLLGEHPGFAQAAGIVLVVAGALLCTYRKTHHRWGVQGVQLVAFGSLVSGTATLADKVAIGYFPILLYAFWLFVLPAAVALAIMGRKAMARMRGAWKRHGAGPLLLLAVASTLPYVALLLALQLMPVSEVVPLINTNIVLTALGGMLLLGEHEGWPQKVLGAILAFAGAWMIGGA